MAKTYNDYPASATGNARKVLNWKKKYGNEVKGMTAVGWARANQLANRESLSYSTIARMAAFNRHRQNAEVAPEYKSTPWKDRGYVAWLGWGGTSGVNWAIRKAESIRNGNLEEQYPEDSDKEMVDGIIEIISMVKDTENRMEIAEKQIQELKDEGVSFDEADFMARVGLGQKMAKQDESGKVSESKKAPKSDTPNESPKNVGEGGKLGPKVIETIKNKVAKHNEEYPQKKITVATARKVVLRGMGAYNKSHSPVVTSAIQWGLARLNAFMYLLVKGKPQNAKYVTDNDLLPSSHPKSSK